MAETGVEPDERDSRGADCARRDGDEAREVGDGLEKGHVVTVLLGGVGCVARWERGKTMRLRDEVEGREVGQVAS